MNGFLATTAYNTAFAFLLADALVPFPPLRWAADKATRAGDELLAAQGRTDRAHHATDQWSRQINEVPIPTLVDVDTAATIVREAAAAR